MKRTELAASCYETIMGLAGSDELKETVKRLPRFWENREANSMSGIALPNYLWIVRHGGGVTTQANAFTEYLYAMRAFEFCGTARFFEFKLGYVPPDTFFSELTRFDNALTGYAGHNRRYKGVACININDWLEHTEEEHFQDFLDYVADNNERLLMVFCIHDEDANIIKTVEAALSARLRIETLSLRFPDAAELVGLVDTWFMERGGYSLAEDAKSLLRETIAEIAAAKSFYGFKTIERLADDMLCSILMSGRGSNREISANMLAGFSTDSTYVKRAKGKLGAKKVIGFTERSV
jgi:hypothetical protein